MSTAEEGEEERQAALQQLLEAELGIDGGDDSSCGGSGGDGGRKRPYEDDEDDEEGGGGPLRSPPPSTNVDPPSSLAAGGASEEEEDCKLPPLPPLPPPGPSYITALPDDLLSRVVAFVGTAPAQLGRVCRRWERVKILVIRDRHIETLAAKLRLPEALCREVEAELFAHTQKRVSSLEYKNALRRLAFNLKEGGPNPTLRERVLSGQLPPGRLVRLSAEEFLTEEERARRDKAGEAAHKRISLSEEEAQAQVGRILSTAYQCARCGHSKCWVRRWWRRKPQVDRYRILATCAKCGEEWDA